jgi:hypothetical protein
MCFYFAIVVPVGQWHQSVLPNCRSCGRCSLGAAPNPQFCCPPLALGSQTYTPRITATPCLQHAVGVVLLRVRVVGGRILAMFYNLYIQL